MSDRLPPEQLGELFPEAHSSATREHASEGAL